MWAVFFFWLVCGVAVLGLYFFSARCAPFKCDLCGRLFDQTHECCPFCGGDVGKRNP